jgi:hypothetical protein
MMLMPSSSHCVNDESTIFRDFALPLRKAGFAVLPATGKSPLMRGFTTWKNAPSESAIATWGAKHSTADIVYVPGLNPIVVLDADDEEADARIVEFFGETPGRIRTRRGRHRLYRRGDADLGTVTSLKPFGLNADVKHGSSIAVAPPSRHADDRSFVYAFEGCDAAVLRDLPPFNAKALAGLIDRPDPKNGLGFRDNSRGQFLNDHLVRFVSQGFDADEDVWELILHRAHEINDGFEKMGLGKLSDKEVVWRAKSVLVDYKAGKFVQRHNRRATATTDADEVRRLVAMHGENALILLLLLRAEHGARCKQGKTFAICPRAMREHEVLANWSAQRYRAARQALRDFGYLREVTPATMNAPAQYILVDRRLTSSRSVLRVMA